MMNRICTIITCILLFTACAEQSRKEEKTEKFVNVKKRQGWDIYSSTEVPNLHVLYKTQKNIDKIQQLLMSNIRSFKIEKFDYQEIEGVEYIKGLTVRIYRKKS